MYNVSKKDTQKKKLCLSENYLRIIKYKRNLYVIMVK